MSHRPAAIALSFVLAALPLLASAHEPEHHATTSAVSVPTEANPAVDVVDRFSAALKAGDLQQAGALLAEDVLILESGGAERSRAEYLAGHANSDAAFLKDAHVQMKHRTAHVEGDIAWVGSESELHATGKDGPLTLLSTETMLLKRTPQGWRIVHIHWSSRPKKVATS
jgi:ketosteroid isomerase-like protein